MINPYFIWCFRSLTYYSYLTDTGHEIVVIHIVYFLTIIKIKISAMILPINTLHWYPTRIETNQLVGILDKCWSINKKLTMIDCRASIVDLSLYEKNLYDGFVCHWSRFY